MSQNPDPRLHPFHHLQTPYKTINNQPIQTDLLIPKSFPHPAPPLPIIIHFHGGGLICGSSLYAPWFPTYLTDLARSTPAILLSPNYRLLPEATIQDVFEDILDFWTWLLHSPDVSALLPEGIDIDRSRVLTAGESAGGYLSLCLALHCPGEVRGAVAAYPAFLGLVPVSSLLVREQGEELRYHHVLLDTALRHAREGLNSVRSFTDLPERIELMDAVMKTGRMREIFERCGGVEEDLRLRYPMAKLDDPALRIPRAGIVILHGEGDEVVPVAESVGFVEKARRVLGPVDGEKVRLVVREGGHGFDVEVGLREGWLWEGLRGVVEGWLD
ncbi:alpha/beta-hydrolase [Aspergillus homomorphus CBS 101889]|uniref:Alpha/beta-hydrolase n=1 Tax=Aspergillus homomorphus (strain CBS 101889) TaxID=1450537 RepID=A0A395HTX9_ASPHC|nr:alpha/beta-hydrolase [Aspergillus homomorphus CBS 101889]RAL10278.1 alpha/beta-hydrolase [Aspergillus homomorphus CBS 101889]